MLSKKGIHFGAYPIVGMKNAPILDSSYAVRTKPLS